MVTDPKVIALLRQENREREERLEDGLDDLHRHIVNAWSRLEIPQNSVYNLRIVAKYLRDLGNLLEGLSHRDDLPAHSVLFEAQSVVRAVNAKMRKLRGMR